MSESHVEQLVAARIAAAKEKTQQQRQERAAFAASRTAGLKARHRNKTRRFRMGYCAACAAPLFRGTYLLCRQGCGAKLCRSGRRCINKHDPHNCPVYQTAHGIAETS